MNTTKSLWCVMRAFPISSIDAMGMKFSPEIGEPTKFIPVFETKAEAEKWAHPKDRKLIRELEII